MTAAAAGGCRYLGLPGAVCEGVALHLRRLQAEPSREMHVVARTLRQPWEGEDARIQAMASVI